ncbi:MAG: hypothetical protein BGO69_00930 [Bacteroidetes bacterium 46-16]|nr:MAG: hypothetical protein BGO69_00930 [Bacteroidetes bacterium 46-16]
MKKHNNLIENGAERSKQPGSKRKGRSNKLVERRNECLLSRYYYYNSYTDKRYEAIMQHLSDEFFLSPTTIHDLLQDNMHYLHELKNEQPKKAYFEHKWPHMTW